LPGGWPSETCDSSSYPIAAGITIRACRKIKCERCTPRWCTYKSWTHEGGISTPMIVRWPGRVKPGSQTNQPAYIIDFMPTFCELAGTDYPSKYGGNEIISVEGKSMLPIFEGKAREPHDQLYWEWSDHRAVRQGKWKLVWDRKTWELYDIDADRTETNDLAKDQPERVEAMSKLWFDWADKTGLKTKE